MGAPRTQGEVTCPSALGSALWGSFGNRSQVSWILACACSGGSRENPGVGIATGHVMKQYKGGGARREMEAAVPTVTEEGFSLLWPAAGAGRCRSYLLQGDDQEGATSRALGDDGQEAGVDGTEVVIVHIFGDGDTVEAVLPVSHLPVDVSELGAAVLWTPGHL